MAVTLTSITDLAALGFDDIIDARAPTEYADDHLPGAISLPVLDDEERARIGTIYKQVSPFSARKIGAALVAQNAARHLLGPLADKPGGWRPLVYCWRGGQRSASFASILTQIGWRAETLHGGYKAWRALVVKALYEQPFPCRVVVLDGNTGSAKTEVLNLLPVRGLQVIDLEGMARHRGSLFGAMAGGQPSQKSFESALAMAISRLDSGRPVVIEAESSKVGERRVPPQIWKAMLVARRLEILAPPRARAQYLVGAYGDMIADGARLAAVIDQLRPLHAAGLIERWQAMALRGEFADLAEALMVEHYDPRYEKHRARIGSRIGSRIGAAMAELPVKSLGPDDLAALADRVVASVLTVG